MNAYARRDKILEDLQRESGGSFSAVYRAMTELSREKKTSELNTDEVKARIRAIMAGEKDIRRRAG
ncbi:hypothetical protein HB779_06185 [Phyllobacterium sp. 628]|uniref:hypothetical protein n=1 Tax=Phyllobacterium sp. 628 TaxID=2718938 RepID=UPI0016626C31|nr:hypothetical protein [Phyllobacterium sp. 628]QND51536.1 hypothetical protein HB779_06185 [Phyllobacterium sp. 628]